MAPTTSAQPDRDLPAKLVERLRTTKVRGPPYFAVASSLHRPNRDGKATGRGCVDLLTTAAAPE